MRVIGRGRGNWHNHVPSTAAKALKKPERCSSNSDHNTKTRQKNLTLDNVGAMGGKIQTCQKCTLVFSQKSLAATGGLANLLEPARLGQFV
jgi:3-deoxy-D-manno-octulosonic-acid transferase